MESSIPECIARMEAEVEGRAVCSRRAQDALDEACTYARMNHLTIDADELDPLSLFYTESRIHSVDDVEAALDDAHLPAAALRPLTRVAERLTAGPAAFRLVQEIFRPYTEAVMQMAIEDLCRINTGNANLSLEVPILCSSHDLDFKHHQELVRNITKTPRLSDHGFPLDAADVEKDEGLQFPKATSGGLSEASAADKIGVQRSGAAYLGKMLRRLKEDVRKEQNILIGELTSYKRNTATEPVTPPLTTRSSPFDDFIPEGDACRIPSASSPASRLSSDAKAAEEAVFRLEGDELSAETILEIDPVAGFLACDGEQVNFIESAAPAEIKPAQLMVDVPLIPDHAGAEYVPPSIQLQDFAPTMTWAEKRDNENIARADQQAAEGMVEIAAKVKRNSEQEQLQPLDARARVSAPVMDFSILPAEWEVCSKDSQKMFDFITEKRPDVFTLAKWRGDKSMEMKMRWAPFDSKAARISAETTIECNDELPESFLGLPYAVPTSDDYVWKAPGLAILQEPDDDDEDLEVATSKDEQTNTNMESGGDGDLMTLVRMKKKKMAAESGEATTTLQKEQQARPSDDRHLSSGFLMGDGEVPATNFVNRYIELRAPEKRAYRKSSFFPDRPPSRQPETTTAASKSDDVGHESQEPQPAPHPPFDASATPSKVIMALTLSRGIRKHLELALPSLGCIERDYNAYNSSMWIPGTVSRAEVPSAFSDEADIILSPATGIMITTMVKVRQKPVPGTNGITVFRDRLGRVAVRYEKLVLLVSEGSKDETLGEMSPSDAVAFAELQGHVLGLDTDVAVYYVGGGEQTVARWAASFVCRNDEASQLDSLLLDAETQWELFLRRAGMNVYAAQVVGRMLKAPDESLEAAGHHGLSAFVQMSAEERLAQFGEILGGRRVLERVGQVINAPWQ